MSKSTADLVLDKLREFGLKEDSPGQYRSNRPWSPNSDSMGLSIKIDGPEAGTYHDFVSGESGSLYELAERIDIKIIRSNSQKYPENNTKRFYKGSEDYAQTHGVDKSVFEAAGCEEDNYYGRPALMFPTQTGKRWRLLDEVKNPIVSLNGVVRVR